MNEYGLPRLKNLVSSGIYLRLRLKKPFDQEGIEIPWPHVKFGQPEVTGLVTCKTCLQANLPNNKFCSQCGASLDSS
ncbi:hypothetical protein ACFLUK_00890 [Chloroflexota bacterium]